MGRPVGYAGRNRIVTLHARITHLEMLERPATRVAMPHGQRVALMRPARIPISFYRYLYREVGKPHHWLLRRDDGDTELSEAIHAATTQIDVLYVDGAPAGFCELDLAQLPGEAEILYFGLISEFQGRGLAKFFLSEAIHAAWDHEPARLVIHTNTLDSPRALQLYQRMGFAPYGFDEEDVEPWA
ncbi:GNAT family N-acetyltransferase [Aliihoeflea sp. PC F10.4]